MVALCAARGVALDDDDAGPLLLRQPHVQDEVAVHLAHAAGERDAAAVVFFIAHADRVARRVDQRDAGAEVQVDLDAQPVRDVQRVRRVDRVAVDLRLERVARAARGDVARRDRRRVGEAHLAVDHFQRPDVRQPHRRGLPGVDVADADREHVRALLLEQVRRVPAVDRRVVLLDRGFRFLHDAGQHAVAGDDFEVANGGVLRERERVDRLDRLRLLVDEGLLDDGALGEGGDRAAEADPAEGDLLVRDAGL
jgi:hypothetical protein